MATLIDARLYLPEDWCNDDERCKKAAVPEAKRLFQSKIQLALAMLKIARQRGIQFGTVGIDGGYGKEPAFLRGVDEQGCRFVADVHCDQTIYRQDPEPLVPEWSGRGRQPRHRKPQSAEQRIDQWAAAQPADAWHNHMALVMLGTLFLVKQKKAGRQQWPMLSFNDLVTALEHLLPRRQLTAEELADIISKRHYPRQKAKESHTRRSQVARE